MTKQAFTRSELKRAVEAARDAGINIGAVEVSRCGTIRVLAADSIHNPPDPFEEFERAEEKRT